MQDVCEPFKSKHITVLGLGLLGRGVGDAEFLASCGAHVVVTDKKNETELAESVKKLKTFPNITFHLGGHREEDFEHADLVIKAAGVPLDSHEVDVARKHNVRVAMSTALFAKSAMEIGVKIVGVTGTRGKSTTAQMIYWSLAETLDPATVHLGGNVRGISTLAMLPNLKEGDLVVLELDSWQLQGFGDLEISPNVAVFTNFMPDHLNYYGGDMETYFADKANLFRFQKPGDSLVVGQSVASRVREANPPIDPVVAQPLPKKWKLQILGMHNRDNAAIARQALEMLGMEEQEQQACLESFEAVEGRLQFVREINGVKIYNDNNATTPAATIAALAALGKNITLITGGSEKNLPLEMLVSSIREHGSHVILLMHENYKGSVRLAGELRTANIPFVEVATLQQAMDVALQTKPAAILFSPAFASFGMFKNEYERNDQFLDIIAKL